MQSEPNFWKIFYVRRATRILPACISLIVVAVATVWLQWQVLWPYYVFFAANFANVYHPDLVGPLVILWSLAVEEHFYLCGP